MDKASLKQVLMLLDELCWILWKWLSLISKRIGPSLGTSLHSLHISRPQSENGSVLRTCVSFQCRAEATENSWEFTWRSFRYLLVHAIDNSLWVTTIHVKVFCPHLSHVALKGRSLWRQHGKVYCHWKFRNQKRIPYCLMVSFINWCGYEFTLLIDVVSK